MKCTNCQLETNDSGDIHCRKIFKTKIERLFLANELEKAEELFRITDFKHQSTTSWKNKTWPGLHYKIIDSLEKEEEAIKVKEEEKIIGPLLLKIQKKERLSDDEILILEKKGKALELANYFYELYKSNKYLWNLSRASRHFRNANNPNMAIEITKEINFNNPDKHALAAVLTTRGGAFKDVREFDNAKECAFGALKYHETFYPYFLLGAIHILVEDLDKANFFFKEAERLGACRAVINREIKKYSAELSKKSREKMSKLFDSK